MKKLYHLISILTVCSLYIISANAQIECNNIVLNKPATASTTSSNQYASKVFDGDKTTNWSATSSKAWIKVDLQNKYSIDSMKLYVNQYYAGNSIHIIKTSEDLTNWTTVKTLSGSTSNNQIITVQFEPALTNVRGIMIDTDNSATTSWVAWYEIKVYSGNFNPTITREGDILSSSTSTNNQWYLNGIAIPDAKSQTHTATVSGSYQVGYTNGSGCESLSNTISVTALTTDINKIDENDIRMYPNPAINFVMIEGVSNGKIEIYNLQGQAIKNFNLSGSNPSLDISDIHSGIYTIKITTFEGIIVKKLLKQ